MSKGDAFDFMRLADFTRAFVGAALCGRPERGHASLMPRFSRRPADGCPYGLVRSFIVGAGAQAAFALGLIAEQIPTQSGTHPETPGQSHTREIGPAPKGRESGAQGEALGEMATSTQSPEGAIRALSYAPSGLLKTEYNF